MDFETYSRSNGKTLAAARAAGLSNEEIDHASTQAVAVADEMQRGQQWTNSEWRQDFASTFAEAIDKLVRRALLTRATLAHTRGL